MSDKDIDTQINALLDITEGNYVEAVYLVCLDIQLKSQ